MHPILSFVRSVSMDTWYEDQVRRMKVGDRALLLHPFYFHQVVKIGGNAPFVAFMQSYTPAEQGGYKEGMSIHEKYHSWAAAQYREKVRT
jgi:ADP-ribosylation factor GTPase-activating protein 1